MELGKEFSEKAVEEELRLKLFKKIPIKKARFKRTFYIIRDKKQTTSPLCEALLQFLSEQR